jgi:hypothetical protein
VSETPAEPQPYPWLPIADVLGWLQIDAGHKHAGIAEWCRRAAASYVEDVRSDLVELVDDVPTFDASDRVKQAGLILAARLFARRSSPAGLAAFAELGAADVVRVDPDVPRLLGLGRHARPQVG